MSEWIRFDAGPPSASGKTKTWDVRTKDGIHILGRVSWYAPWRRYSFWPDLGTVFEGQCLRDIASFCDTSTAAHKSPPIEKAP